MNISLRKANVIQNGITEAIKKIKIEHTVELNEFQDVAVALEKANTALMENDARRQKLLLALYNIRGLVGAANASAGIDLSLSKAAFIDKRIGQLEELANATVITDLAVINGKLEKIRSDKSETSRSRIYGYTDTVSTSVLSEDQIAQAKAEINTLKRQKQKINDDVLELNIKTEIPLSADVVTTLLFEGLV
jgi:hypothetical protein